MISTSTQFASVIQSGGYQRRFVCDVIVDGERVLEDHPLSDVQIKSNGNAKIRTQGSATFVYSDADGRTIVPETMTSWLTPFATYLNVSMLITAGTFREKVLLGLLKIVSVDDPQETKVRQGDRIITVGSSVGLTLADAFVVTAREQFIAPSSPSQLGSVWAEIGLLTGLPLLRNITDPGITRAVTYKEDRLDAVFDLASILDAIPYVNNFGQVTCEPNAWGTEQEELTIGPEGTITDVRPDQLDADNVYNQVVVRSHDDDQTLVLAHRELTDGPLRYGGPFGRVPYFASSQYVTTEAEAIAYAESQLPIVSSLPAASYIIQCLPDPRREVGDVIPFTRLGETLVGRVLERTLTSSGPMTLRMLVDRG